MAWVAVGSAAVNVIGSVLASNSARSASRDATRAQTEASDRQIALAREQMNRASALLQPEVDRGTRAQSYVDALTYGSSAMPAGGAATYGGAPVGSPDWQAYWNNNPDIQTNGWNTFTPQQRQDWFQNDPLVYAQWHANEFNDRVVPTVGAQGGAGAGGAGGAPLTRADAEAQVEATMPYRLGEDEFAAQNQITDQTYAGANSLANEEYDAMWGVADGNYGDFISYADNARTGRRGVAQSNLDQRLDNNRRTYDAWDAQAQDEARKAVDQTFSRGGVTGLVGQTRAGVAEVGQDYALQAARERAALDADAYDPYFDDVTGAEVGYWDTVGGATGARADARTYATETRAGRRQGAYDSRQRGYASNQATRTANRQATYADYLAGLRGEADRGYSARTGQASAGQTYANAASGAVGRAADAASADAQRRGEIQQTLYGDIARTVGNAWGAITADKKDDKIQTTYGGSSRTPNGRAPSYG